MTVDSLTQLRPAYLQLQPDRCQRLSRSCTDLGTARDLRLMSEEYFAEGPEKGRTESAQTGRRCIMSRKVLYLIVGMLDIAVVAIGYQHYHERHKRPVSESASAIG
jgi:hypothetical protein